VLYLAMRFVRGQARSPGRRRRAAHRISGLLPSALAVQLVAEAVRAFVRQG
jgi:small neutral amino acid transporter SnatA (MarC family)